MANLMPGESYGIPDDLYAKRAERKRRLAEALKRDSVMPQGQMVSGHFVAPSITQYLASGLKGYQSGQLERESSKEEEAGAMQKQQRLATAQQKYLDALRPQQVQTGETKQPFEASQMDRFGAPQQGQVQATQPVMGQRQPTPEDMYRAQMQYAMDLQDPQAMLTASNNQIGYQTKQADREDEQTFRQQQAEETRAAREQELMFKIADAQASRAEQIAARKELAEMNNAARGDMARLTASLRPAPQQGAPVAVVDPATGKPVYVSPTEAYGKAPYKTGNSAPLSATAQKELFEAEDVAQSSNNAIGMLQEALTLNKKAYAGIGAKPRAVIASNLGMGAGGADATINLDNLMTGQALESLKATFGGMPTEGERKILLDMQASADKTPAQRKAILERAIQSAKKRAEFSSSKSQSLREGTYFSPQQPQVERRKSNANVKVVDW